MDMQRTLTKRLRNAGAVLLALLAAAGAGCTNDADDPSAADSRNGLGEPVAEMIVEMSTRTCPSAATATKDCSVLADPENYAVRITGVTAGDHSTDSTPVARRVALEPDGSIAFDSSVPEHALVHLVCATPEPAGSCDPSVGTGQVVPTSAGGTLRWIPIGP